ncbi:MAG: flagellar basal body FlgE domain-containing protein [Nannocystales bacterium]
MRVDRHLLAAVFTTLVASGCGASQDENEGLAPRACEGAGVAENPFELGNGDISVFVCGAGTVQVSDEGRVLDENELHLRVDEQGALVDEDDRSVLGVSVEVPTLSPVSVPLAIPGVATQTVELAVNLDRTVPRLPFDPLDPVFTSDYQTSISIYDEMGVSVEVQVFFAQTPDKWKVYPMAERGVEGQDELLGVVTLDFGADGELAQVEGEPLIAPWAEDNEAVWHLEFDPARTTSVAGASSVRGVSSDGREPGVLRELTLSPRGEVVATYSNGRVVSAAWILDGLEGWLVPMN